MTARPARRRIETGEWGASALALLAAAALVGGCQLDRLVSPAASELVEEEEETSPPPVSLAASPELVEATVSESQATPTSAEVALEPTGGAWSVEWTARTVFGSAWLSMASDRGTAPGTLVLTLDPTGLAPGTYVDTVVVEPSREGSVPARIPALLEVMRPDPDSGDDDGTGGTDDTDGGDDAPDDENDPPAAPASLDQLASDGVTSVPIGGTVSASTVFIAADLSDPDEEEKLRLEVEVKPVGTDFDGSDTVLGPEVDAPTRASVSLDDFQDATSYHWRVRAVDDDGVPGPWTSFGGNTEGEIDFRVESGS